MTGRQSKTARLFVATVILVVAAFGILSDAAAQPDEDIEKNAAILRNPEATDAQRLSAATALIIHFNNGKSEALKPLEEALDRQAPQTAKPVLNALGTQGIPEPLVQKVIAGLDGTDDGIRKAAEEALTGNVRENSVGLYKAVLEALKNRKSPDRVRTVAARIVGNSGRESACNDLIAALNSRQIKDVVCIEIVKALGTLASKDAVPHLIEMLEGHSPSVTKACVASLHKITFRNFGTEKSKWEEWWKANKDKDFARDFIRALQRNNAEELIKVLKDKPAFEDTMKAFNDSSSKLTPSEKYGIHHPDVVKAAVEALIKVPPDEKQFDKVIPYLNAFLSSDEIKVRKAVLAYFANKGASVRQHVSSVSPILDRYLDDTEDEPAKDLSLEALKTVIDNVRSTTGRLDVNEKLLKRLSDAMSDTIKGPSHRRRLMAVEILGAGLRTYDGLSKLVELLRFEEKPSEKPEDRELRKRVAYSIAPVLEQNGGLKLTDKQKEGMAVILGRALLRDAIVAPDIARPLASLAYSGKISIDDVTYEGVSGLLNSRLTKGIDRDVKLAVLNAFERLKNPRTEKTIIEALKNPDAVDPNDKPPAGLTLTETALATLGEVGGRDAFTYLLGSQIPDKNEKTKIAAWTALNKVVKTLLADGWFEFLIENDGAVGQAAKDVPAAAKKIAEDTQDVLAQAPKSLEDAKKALTESVKGLDPSDPKRAALTREKIEAELNRNRKTMHYAIVEALSPASGNSEEIREAVRAILVKTLEREDVASMSYEQVKDLLKTIFPLPSE